MTLRSGEVYFSEQDSSFIIPESISLFGLSISFYGLFLVLAALIGLIFVKEAVRRKKQDTEKSLTLFTVVIIFALIGARLYYVLFDWQTFVQNPIAIFRFRSGGLSYFGGLFGAWSAVKWFCRRTKTDFFAYADTLSMGAACAAPFVWAGCAFVREPLGRFYDGLFSVRIKTEYLRESTVQYAEELLSNAWDAGDTVTYMCMHPVAVYGIALSIVLFVVLCICAVKSKTDGTVFTAYLTMNAGVILVLEYFRADRAYIWGTEIPVNYVVAGVILATIAVGKVRQLLKKRKEKRKIFPAQ